MHVKNKTTVACSHHTEKFSIRRERQGGWYFMVRNWWVCISYLKNSCAYTPVIPQRAGAFKILPSS